VPMRRRPDERDRVPLELGRVPLAHVALATHDPDCFLRDSTVPVSGCPVQRGNFNTLHHLDADDGRSRLQLFFRPARHTGQVRNAEPHKCEELRWWPLDHLPTDIVPYTAHALGEIGRGKPLSVVGWPD
ncbi:hypothetical protein ACWGJO_40475, partial [Kitasatospora sp. NPDC054795]